jgi:hypothetical protein
MYLKATIWSQHVHCRGLVRIFGRENNLPMVTSTVIGCIVGQRVQKKVPLKKIVFGWLYRDLRILRFSQAFEIVPQASCRRA